MLALVVRVVLMELLPETAAVVFAVAVALLDM